MRINRKHAIAAAAAGLLTTVAMFLAAPGHGHGHTRATAGRVLPAAPLASSSVLPSPVLELSGVRWVSYHGVRLPVSAQAGPRDTAFGLASGFADTPLGALLAAINIGVRTSWELGPDVFQPTIQQQVTGPFEAAMLSADLDDWGQGAEQVTGTGPDAVEAGYQWAGYTPSAATADVVTEGTAADGSTVYAVTQIQVQWLAGDWRVVAPPGGDWANDVTQVASLNGYLTFPGQEG